MVDTHSLTFLPSFSFPYLPYLLPPPSILLPPLFFLPFFLPFSRLPPLLPPLLSPFLPSLLSPSSLPPSSLLFLSPSSLLSFLPHPYFSLSPFSLPYSNEPIGVSPASSVREADTPVAAGVVVEPRQRPSTRSDLHRLQAHLGQGHARVCGHGMGFRALHSRNSQALDPSLSSPSLSIIYPLPSPPFSLSLSLSLSRLILLLSLTSSYSLTLHSRTRSTCSPLSLLSLYLYCIPSPSPPLSLFSLALLSFGPLPLPSSLSPFSFSLSCFPYFLDTLRSRKLEALVSPLSLPSSSIFISLPPFSLSPYSLSFPPSSFFTSPSPSSFSPVPISLTASIVELEALVPLSLSLPFSIYLIPLLPPPSLSLSFSFPLSSSLSIILFLSLTCSYFLDSLHSRTRSTGPSLSSFYLSHPSLSIFILSLSFPSPPSLPSFSFSLSHVFPLQPP
ncbi:hypothetical protein C7M84_016396 [Penaeus vannamei]|uniref:Uncharacterized protein n=1 Tax=Penaeus vannamei TaxID=6689 RepID=A0A423SN18_PENVA|nr:hypothetical protein C7M84_016396 [Penaeus vannamei]